MGTSQRTVPAVGPISPVGHRSHTAKEASAPLLTLILAEVAAQARIGHFSEAEALLLRLPPEEQGTPAALDLLARMRAQQGRLRDAENLWSGLSQAYPDNETYARALRTISTLQRRPVWFRRALSFAPATALVICIVAAIFAVQRHTSTRRASEVASSIAHHSSSAESPPAGDTWKPPDIQDPGIVTEKTPNQVSVNFRNGIFQHGITLRPDAKKEIVGLARQLRPYADSISITVVGCTDDLPVRANSQYRGNVALRLARANAVFLLLTKTAGLPETSLSIQSSPFTPYPNDSPDNQARNRTVILRVAPIQR
jgi:type VI secretion system protein ImpK